MTSSQLFRRLNLCFSETQGSLYGSKELSDLKGQLNNILPIKNLVEICQAKAV
jgi:hypothetical protein